MNIFLKHLLRNTLICKRAYNHIKGVFATQTQGKPSIGSIHNMQARSPSQILNLFSVSLHLEVQTTMLVQLGIPCITVHYLCRNNTPWYGHLIKHVFWQFDEGYLKSSRKVIIINTKAPKERIV